MRLRIVYMGTPEFAVPPLAALHAAPDLEVVAVVTAPDKPAGRGQKLQQSAVKCFAVQAELPVLQPTNLKSPEFIAELSALKPDLQVVVAFRMLPEAVWALPPLGTFNLHASLLPDYRGAAPINWAVINGETETGLTTFLLDKQIDTGRILFQTRVSIPFEADAGQLHDILMALGPDLILKTARALREGTAEALPQDEHAARHHAPKIFPEDCRIDWNRPMLEVYNRIRGLSPYPGAWTTLDGKRLKVFASFPPDAPTQGPPYALETRNEKPFGPPGTCRVCSKERLKVSTADGVLSLAELQLEGKRRMHSDELFRGFACQNWLLGA